MAKAELHLLEVWEQPYLAVWEQRILVPMQSMSRGLRQYLLLHLVSSTWACRLRIFLLTVELVPSPKPHYCSLGYYHFELYFLLVLAVRQIHREVLPFPVLEEHLLLAQVQNH